MITIKKIIKGNTKTLAELNAIITQLSSSSKPLTRAALANIFKNKNLEFWVVRDGTKIIGMGSLVVWYAPTGIRSRIEDVVMDASYRGRGLGTLLTKKLMQAARRTHAKDIELSSRPGRVSANTLYQKLGFTQKETNVYFLKLKNT